MRATLLLLTISACAASTESRVAPVSTAGPPPSASASAPPVASAPAKPAAPVVLSPGIVLIGDVVGPPQFDPKAGLQALKPELLRCYNEARLLTPDLHGKMTLQIQVGGSGSVSLVSAAPGGTLSDAGLLACIGDAAKAVSFPKPGGLATISVPVVFHP